MFVVVIPQIDDQKKFLNYFTLPTVRKTKNNHFIHQIRSKNKLKLKKNFKFFQRHETLGTKKLQKNLKNEYLMKTKPTIFKTMSQNKN